MTKAPNSIHDDWVFAFDCSPAQSSRLSVVLVRLTAHTHRPTICMQNVAGVELRTLGQE